MFSAPGVKLPGPRECFLLSAPLALAVMLHGALAVKTLRLTALVPAAHAKLVHDEVQSGVFGVVPGPLGMGELGAGVRDAALLRSVVVNAVVEGAHFRLSVVATDTP